MFFLNNFNVIKKILILINYVISIEAKKTVIKAVIGVVNDLNVVGIKFCINKPTIKDITNIDMA